MFRQVQLHVKLKTKRTTKIYLNDVKKFGPSTDTWHSNNLFFNEKYINCYFLSKQVQQHVVILMPWQLTYNSYALYDRTVMNSKTGDL